ARGGSIGTIAAVRGVVTAEAGRLGTPPLIAVQDATGGIVVRLPDGVAHPPRGTVVVVRGPLADPYGQLELRPSAGGVAHAGTGAVPIPLTLNGLLGEATEGRLVAAT